MAIGCMTVEGRLNDFLRAAGSGKPERFWRVKFDALRAATREIPGADALVSDLYDAAVAGRWRDVDLTALDLHELIARPR